MAKKEEQPAEEEKQAPIIMALADVSDWEIGPTKENPCTLTVKLHIPNYEDTRTIRQLASGRVVLRVMPLQFNLPFPTLGCDHPTALQVDFSSLERVCLQCGEVTEIPKDDLKPAPPAQGELPKDDGEAQDPDDVPFE